MKGSDIMVNLKKKDGFQNETIWKLVTENPNIEVNEHKNELVIPIR